MVSITLKNIPKDLHQRLKKQAKDHRRSLNGEIIARLEGIGVESDVDTAAIIKRVRILRKGIKGHLTQEILSELKEVGRK